MRTTACPAPTATGYASLSTAVCSPIEPGSNKCQTFCEMRRISLLGIETPVGGIAGTQQTDVSSVTCEKVSEVSVSHGFSIGAEGIVKEVIGAGVDCACK